jgi:hypothetical protein
VGLLRPFISTGVLARTVLLLVGLGHVGNMDQAAFLIELADDVRELLSRSAGQNDGRTLIPKASDCYSAHAGAGTGHDDSLETHVCLPHECSGLLAVLLKKSSDCGGD